jgi:hypothetical protein
MEISSKYGIFKSTDPLVNDPSVSKDIENLINAAELFFQDSVSVDDDELSERIKVAWAKTMDNPAKAWAIMEFVPEWTFDDISTSDWNENLFEHKNYTDTYLILTDEEADNELIEYEKDLLNDIGVRGAFPSDVIDDIIDDKDLVDNEWFREFMEDDNYSYAEEIQSESSFPHSDYVNRLHEELCQADLMDEPEWPEFVDDSEEHSDEVEELRQQYEEEAESKIQEYADYRNKDYENPGEWFKDHFGDEEYKDKVDENELWNIEAIVKKMIDGGTIERGNLSSYDGIENDQSIEFNGKKYHFYIYQMD